MHDVERAADRLVEDYSEIVEMQMGSCQLFWRQAMLVNLTCCIVLVYSTMRRIVTIMSAKVLFCPPQVIVGIDTVKGQNWMFCCNPSGNKVEDVLVTCCN